MVELLEILVANARPTAGFIRIAEPYARAGHGEDRGGDSGAVHVGEREFGRHPALHVEVVTLEKIEITLTAEVIVHVDPERLDRRLCERRTARDERPGAERCGARDEADTAVHVLHQPSGPMNGCSPS